MVLRSPRITLMTSGCMTPIERFSYKVSVTLRQGSIRLGNKSYLLLYSIRNTPLFPHGYAPCQWCGGCIIKQAWRQSIGAGTWLKAPFPIRTQSQFFMQVPSLRPKFVSLPRNRARYHFLGCKPKSGVPEQATLHSQLSDPVPRHFADTLYLGCFYSV